MDGGDTPTHVISRQQYQVNRLVAHATDGVGAGRLSFFVCYLKNPSPSKSVMGFLLSVILKIE